MSERGYTARPMLRSFWLFVSLFALPAVAAPPTKPRLSAEGIPGSPTVEVDAAGDAVFRDAGQVGAFVLLDVQRNVVKVVNPELATQGQRPCSTFKIPNTLIGLETGVIPGPHMRLEWDGKKRTIAEWNRTHDLSTAMRDSVVWFYQEVARRIGLERMRERLQQLSYGNHEVGKTIDTFWLEGPLRISPLQQVSFLRRLQLGALPVHPANAALVRQLIVLEQSHGRTLRGKTGLCHEGKRAVGWLVGEVERSGRPYVYATLVTGEGPVDRLMASRRTVTETFLERYLGAE